MQKLLTVKETAAYLNVHEMTVRKMMSKREIPFIKKKGIGIRIRIEDLDTWLSADLHVAEGWTNGQIN
jgi:excisionase family DNA binding protein